MENRKRSSRAFGEDEIKAVVVPRDGSRIDLPQLIEFVAAKLPYFMVPRYIEILAELPRTPTQKTRKHELRRPLDQSAWDREAAGVRITRQLH